MFQNILSLLPFLHFILSEFLTSNIPWYQNKNEVRVGPEEAFSQVSRGSGQSCFDPDSHWVCLKSPSFGICFPSRFTEAQVLASQDTVQSLSTWSVIYFMIIKVVVNEWCQLKHLGNLYLNLHSTCLTNNLSFILGNGIWV